MMHGSNLKRDILANNICVIGAGRWGKNHVKTLHELNLLGAVVEPDPTLRNLLQKTHPNVAVLQSIDEALEIQDISGFTVATPAQTHYAIARKLLESGKHVLVEKPLTLASKEASDLERLANANNINLMVGHLMLFHPAIIKMRSLIDSGAIGTLQYLDSTRLSFGSIRTEEDVIWSFAPHDLSIFDYFIGDEPSKVSSHGAAFITEEICDISSVNLEYPESVSAHIYLSWLYPFKQHRLVVGGETGSLVFFDSEEEKPLLQYNNSVEWQNGIPMAKKGDIVPIEYEPGMALTYELAYFADHFDGTSVEIANGESAVRIVKILERLSPR